MTALELLLLTTSIVAWTLLLVAHRRHVRAMRALAAEHKTALARKHIDSVRLGMMEERERWERREAQGAYRVIL